MTGYPHDFSRPTYPDTSEGLMRSSSGGSRPPFDIMRSTAPVVTEPLSALEAPAGREEVPVLRLTRAMSPGETIHNLGIPKSTERQAFIAVSAKFIVDSSGNSIGRPTNQQLTSKDISRLTNKNCTFATIKGWESFEDHLPIQSRAQLAQARAAFRREAACKGKKTLGAEGRSEAARKGKKTLGAEGRSEAIRKGNEIRGSEGRSAAARKGHKSKGAEERARISALANVAYQQRGLERYGEINAFSEALEDTIMANQEDYASFSADE